MVPQEEKDMVFEPDNRLKQKMMKNGSVLQFMYSASGAGKGLAAMGGMLIVIGAALAAALSNTVGTQGAVKLAAAMAVPGILLLILGIFMQQKKERGWAEAHIKACGLTQQDLRQIDQEFQKPGTILLAMDKGKDTNSLKRMGFITDHYVRFPAIGPCVFRLEDVVACFYTKKYLCQDGGYDTALVAYFVDGDTGILHRNPPEKASIAIVKAIGERNPRIITDHFFTYEGEAYDAVKEPEKVVQLHKRVYGKM